MEPSYSLHIENYLTIEQLDLDLSPGVQGLVGKNAEGKTNILKAIEAIATGKSDPKSIRDGAERSVLRLEVKRNGEVVSSVSRIQTSSGTRLEHRGIPANTTPMQYLTSLLDSRMLNPIKILRGDTVEYLKQHLPVEIDPEKDLPEGFKELDLQIPPTQNAFLYSEFAAKHIGTLRLELGRDVKDLDAVVRDISVDLPPNRPTDPFDEGRLNEASDNLKQELGVIRARNDERDKALRGVKSEIDRLDQLKTEGENLYKQSTQYLNEFDELKKKLDLHESKREQVATRVTEQDNRIKQAQKAADDIKIPDATTIKQHLSDNQGKIDQIHVSRQTAKRWERAQERRAELDKKRKLYEKYDVMAKHFKYKLPELLIERAGVPVEGMTFQNGELFVKGRRVDLLSETEQAIVATKLAIALAKKKGQLVISLDGVEIMDDEHRKIWLEAAKNSDLKVFYTRQGTPDGPHEFLVEGGKVLPVQ